MMMVWCWYYEQYAGWLPSVGGGGDNKLTQFTGDQRGAFTFGYRVRGFFELFLYISLS